MFYIILFSIIALLLALSITLFLKLQKLTKSPLSKHNALVEEEVFQAMPLPIVYKKNGAWHTNKLFSHAFGTLCKENAELLSTLPKHTEHSHELTFDNGITKQTRIYTAPLMGSTGDFVAIVVDIASLHKSKVLLMQQKERLELALEGSGEALWDWDLKSDLIFYSQKWKQMMGYDANETPSTLSSWLNVVHSKDMAFVNERLKAHLDGKSDTFMVEHRIRQSDPLRWVRVKGKVIRGKDDQAIRMVGTFLDITLRKEEEARASLESERFRAFIEGLPLLAFIKDIHGHYLYLNPSHQKFLGFTSWKNKKADNLFDPKTAEALSEIDRLTLYEGNVKHEISLPTPEGNTHHFDLYEYAIEEEGRKLLCGVSINKSFK